MSPDIIALKILLGLLFLLLFLLPKGFWGAIALVLGASLVSFGIGHMLMWLIGL